jgi:RNA polymerase sigma factor (sigma-70 family)
MAVPVNLSTPDPTQGTDPLEGEMIESSDPDVRRREDEWLVVRCQLGERPAFDELIQRWHEPLWKYVRRLTGDDEAARDTTQDVWLRVLRGIGRLRDGSKLRPWLFGIARRAVMDRLREQYATPLAGDVDVTAIAAADPPIELEEELRTMQQELSRLPVIEREALTLFYLQELSLVEVAEVLGVPVGTVKSRLFRARHLLRRELDANRRHA